MQYIRGMESFQETSKTAITLGKFDGFHRGHLKLIERVQQYASDDIKSVVFSFDMVPFFKKKGIDKKNLMTNEEKYLFLQDKVDYFIECPFLENVYMMEAEMFIEEILVKQFHAKYIVVGTDYHFGHQKRGDIHMLKQYEEKYGYQLDVIEKERYHDAYHDREISSTFIKEEMGKGSMELVEELLGRPYWIRGFVEHGQKLGRKLGFPTMNIVPCPEKLLPPNGVYICEVSVEGRNYKGIGNIGCKPTVSKEHLTTVEVFLFDYEGDTYGKEIEVRLRTYVRPEYQFPSVEELQQRVSQDIVIGKKYFKM